MVQQVELVCWPSRDRLLFLSRNLFGLLDPATMCRRLGGYVDGSGAAILWSAARHLEAEHASTVEQWWDSAETRQPTISPEGADAERIAALEAELAELRADRERLDWLEKTVIHQSRYKSRDVLLMHDEEDGVWISTVDRREVRAHIPMENEPICVSIRDTIDAARKAGS